MPAMADTYAPLRLRPCGERAFYAFSVFGRSQAFRTAGIGCPCHGTATKPLLQRPDGGIPMVDRVEFTMGQIKIHASQDAIWSQNFSHQYRCYYNRKRSRLNELCELHGSDKGVDAKNAPYPWPAHSYADYVERHFGAFRNYIRNVFECGLGSNDPAIPSNMTKPEGQAHRCGFGATISQMRRFMGLI